MLNKPALPNHYLVKLVGLVTLTVCIVLLLATSWSIYQTKQALAQIKKGQIDQAQSATQQALLSLKPLSLATLGLSQSVLAWQTGLEILSVSIETLPDLQTLSSTIFVEQNNPHDLGTNFAKLTYLLPELDKYLEKSLLLQRLPELSAIRPYLPLLSDTAFLLQDYFSHQHTILIVLQNSEEIRPTGGFMGSFIFLKLKNGQIVEMEIQDIYEPNGQVSADRLPPPGVREYLSDGGSWHLVDSNWHADFPTAAQDILHMFALAKRQNIDTVITINLEIAEQLLTILGPVYLPDYNQTVTPDNLAEAARADRAHFFPGSQQKRQFLLALFNQLELKLETVTPVQQRQLVELFFDAVKRKHTQIYSVQPHIQTVFNRYGWSSSLPPSSLYDKASSVLPSTIQDTQASMLYLIEANVGINKANKNLKRMVEVRYTPQGVKLTLEFINQNDSQKNPPPSSQNPFTAGAQHLHYVNYQRLILPTGVTVKSVTQDQHPLNWTNTEISTNSNHIFQETGFLATILEQERSQIEVQLENFPLTEQLLIIKQAGLPPVPYTVINHSQRQTITIDRDTLVKIK